MWLLKTLLFTFFLCFSLSDLIAIWNLITMILANDSEKHIVADGVLQKMAAWQFKCIVKEVRLCDELSFPFSPVPFRKIRLVVPFQRIKLQQFSSWMLPNHGKIGNIFSTDVRVSLEGRLLSSDNLILVLLMSKGDTVVIMINNKYFSHIFRLITWFVNSISFVASNTTSRKWEPSLTWSVDSFVQFAWNSAKILWTWKQRMEQFAYSHLVNRVEED